ncbi:F0F1 ATP synthase subunit delta [Geodermatophilus maliterrae]|uniref:ATP synthase subunit delta n=1 Tax=Geodermatophilus maliterrae TaxID=3162531 RepID=A0ABV3XAG0_9ACTN
MDASSREAIALSRERLAEITRGAAAPGVLALAEELFAVARLLEGNVTLRRALSDPSGKPADRAALAGRILDGRVSEATVDLVQTVARQRWSRPLDLVEAVETLATEASLDAAESRGELEGVEDELFRFGRIVVGNRELTRILSDDRGSVEGKTALLDRLLSGRVSPVTEQLLRNSLTSRHVGTAGNRVERLSEAASARRGRSVAHVITAQPLSATQEQRLRDVLGRIYGRAIGLQVTVDPDVLGGLVVRVGDEVIDGSVAHRLEAAGRRLTG